MTVAAAPSRETDWLAKPLPKKKDADAVDQLNQEAKSTRLHLLPCHIDHNGAANVDTYFHPQTNTADTLGEQQQQQRWKASFRGHALDGVQLTAPPNYTGKYLFCKIK